MQKFLHKSLAHSAAPWIVNLATFFGPPVAILINKARLHMYIYAMPRPHSVCGTWWICMPQWTRWLACTPLLYWATCYYIFMSIYDVHIHSTLVNRTWFQRFGQANKSTSCDYKIAGRIWLGVKNVSWWCVCIFLERDLYVFLLAS